MAYYTNNLVNGNIFTSTQLEEIETGFATAESVDLLKAGLADANTFTAAQTITAAAAASTVNVDATTTYDAEVNLKENAVTAMSLVNDASLDKVTFTKYQSDGSTISSVIEFDEAGVINVSTGALQIGGIVPWSSGNDGTGSGLDADLLDGVDGADYARISVANAFTEDQTITSTSGNSDLFVDANTGENANVWVKENAVNSAVFSNDATSSVANIIKYQSDGVTQASKLTFDETGNVNLATGTLQEGGEDVATLGINTFTNTQTITTSGAGSNFVINATAGNNSAVYLQENSVTALVFQNNATLNRCRSIKYAADGATAASIVDFYEDGDVDLSVGNLQQSGYGVTYAAVKSASEGLDNNATPQADDELTVPITAGESYGFDIILIFDSSTTADFKIGLSVPASSFGVWDHSNGIGLALTSTFTIPGNGIGTYNMYHFYGCVTPITSGNLTVRWSQNTAELSVTSVRQGSMLRVTKQA